MNKKIFPREKSSGLHIKKDSDFIYNKKKRIVVVLVFSLLMLALVMAPDSEPEINQKFVEDFFSGTGEISDSNLKIANDNKEEFIKKFSEKTQFSVLEGMTDKIKGFDKEGNMILENEHKVPLKEVYDYSTKIDSGESKLYEYEFKGRKFKANPLAIKEITFKDENLVYDFHNGGKLTLSSESNYDPASRTITTKDGKKFQWLGMNGDVVVTGDKINLNIIFAKEGETDSLKDFPLLRTEDGTVMSNYHKVVGGVKLPDGIDPKKISKGRFRTFKADGKIYSVDSTGVIREIGSTSVNLGSERIIATNTYVHHKDYGGVFLGKDVQVFFGGNPPDVDTKGNLIFISEVNSDGKRSIFIRSNDGETFYELNSNVGKLHLDGEVYVKNGDIVIRSTKEGRILFWGPNSDAKFKYDIDQLLNVQKPENEYTEIKEGQTISDVTGAVFIDLSTLTTGRSSANFQTILASSEFNALTTGMTSGNKNSLAIVVARNLKRLNLKDNSENIKLLTKEIIRARENFETRVLFGNSLDKAIGLFGREGAFSHERWGMDKVFYDSGIDRDKIIFTHTDRQGALNALATATDGPVTFLFNGHGATTGMMARSGFVSYKQVAAALNRRYQVTGTLNDVNIISFACKQYDNLENIRKELKNRYNINSFPVMISQAQPRVNSDTRWHSTVEALLNRPSGTPIYGKQFFGAELGRDRYADPALLVPVKLNLRGQEVSTFLEIS